MNVILTKDHNELGVNGSMVKVSEGYARNYLLPNNMAVRATANVMAHYESRRKARSKKEAAVIEDANKRAEEMSKLVVLATVRVGEEGRLYGTVTTKEIAALLQEQHGIEVDKKHISIASPIKSVGLHSISIKLHPEISAQMQVDVQGDGEEEYEEFVEPVKEVAASNDSYDDGYDDGYADEYNDNNEELDVDAEA